MARRCFWISKTAQEVLFRPFLKEELPPNLGEVFPLQDRTFLMGLEKEGYFGGITMTDPKAPSLAFAEVIDGKVKIIERIDGVDFAVQAVCGSRDRTLMVVSRNIKEKYELQLLLKQKGEISVVAALGGPSRSGGIAFSPKSESGRGSRG